jgi:hypothetical protein
MLAKVLANSLNCIDPENADEMERHRLRAETTDRGFNILELCSLSDVLQGW